MGWGVTPSLGWGRLTRVRPGEEGLTVSRPLVLPVNRTFSNNYSQPSGKPSPHFQPTSCCVLSAPRAFLTRNLPSYLAFAATSEECRPVVKESVCPRPFSGWVTISKPAACRCARRSRVPRPSPVLALPSLAVTVPYGSYESSLLSDLGLFFSHQGSLN